MGNICSDQFKAHGPHFVRFIRLECQNKYFLVWASSLVNKSILCPGLGLFFIFLRGGKCPVQLDLGPGQSPSFYRRLLGSVSDRVLINRASKEGVLHHVIKYSHGAI